MSETWIERFDKHYSVDCQNPALIKEFIRFEINAREEMIRELIFWWFKRDQSGDDGIFLDFGPRNSMLKETLDLWERAQKMVEG